MQKEVETKECTFSPNVIASAMLKTDRCKNLDGPEEMRPPLHERLHKEAREREAARILAQHHLEAEILRECTFQASDWGVGSIPFAFPWGDAVCSCNFFVIRREIRTCGS